jgi:acyl-CoA dehydrogenase
MADQVKPLERRVFDAKRAGQIDAEDTPGQIDEAERKNIVTAEEAEQIRAFDATVMSLTGVDDFAAGELCRTSAPEELKSKRKTSRNKVPATRPANAVDEPAAGSL